MHLNSFSGVKWVLDIELMFTATWCRVIVGCLIAMVFQLGGGCTSGMPQHMCLYVELCYFAGVKMLQMLYSNVFVENYKYNLTVFISKGFTGLKAS